MQHPAEYELLRPMGYGNSSRCGYCGTQDSMRSGTRLSYYAGARSLSPQFYQILLNRCWRRSGTLLYRPNQRQACCPHYTIRLDATEFKPTRDQRQTVNRFNKYILGQGYMSESARVYPKSKQEAKRRDNEFCLCERIREAQYSSVRTPPEPAHKLVVTLEHDVFTEEKYQVYKNYQQVVHHEAPESTSPRAFERFLCSSPLRRQEMTAPDGRKRRLGSYHQCYRIDGVLVAIGVLDLLPNCVSSVYFVYHQDIHKQAPGKLGALYEIALAIEEGYGWWYPGFYIHNCPKMKYKIDFSPEYVLDPQTLTWDLLDEEALSILDKKPFLSLSMEREARARGPRDDEGSDAEAASDNGQSKTTGEVNLPLLHSDMPGIPSLEEMQRVDLDHVAITLSPYQPCFETADLMSWCEGDITDWPSLKATVAELVAATGTDLVDSICLDFST
ncbi:hypothetical protein CDD82_1617 [Ophiocordyceps australis]|uniref:arginyltransferase n=1 Tax=Ophiocordyceps australis TaxID=1399860 RepID=A0A2C5YZ55_9HYPO|nr:hypothetical protein CDD82_1617 [Ophiocordyceps australis]